MALRGVGDDSRERLAVADGGVSVRLSRDTIRFWIQLIVMIVTISIWGLLSRADTAAMAAHQQDQRDEIDRLSKEMRMLQLDIKSLQLALAAKGIVVKGEE